ncbi:MAG: HNH endonuclease [Candidatus Marinimicrobia bacterium]|nr:HNH endonuclease [Candidatus Neomarinimicrobiota bacterium]
MNTQVLLLNQSYEPLQICNMRRAIILIFLGKAHSVEQFDDEIRSVSYSIKMPAVIRIYSYINLPRNSIVLTRKNILKRDSLSCQYCGTKSSPLTVDHIIPKVKGGKDSWENLTTACVSCNNKKGNRTLREANLKLLSKPRVPSRITFIQRFVRTPIKEWRPYLFMD